MSALAVVFGGSGFLGSHVVDALIERGYRVRIFDIQPSLFVRPGQQGVEMLVGDIRDLAAVEKAVQDADFVYNFAGLADIDDAKNRPIATVELNVLGTVHMLEACRKAGVKRFIFASTVYVYSESGSFYRASKQACERYVEAYQERYGLPYTILRYGSLYGRRADRRNGIFRMLHAALTEGRIVYQGTGEESREYIHVRDAAVASVRILADEYANQNVVLTGADRLKVRDLMTMIREMLGNRPELDFLSKPIEGHYKITPYAFHPRMGVKLVGEAYTDIGQGLLDCLAELHERLHAQDEEAIYGVLVPKPDKEGTA